jgi:hypothetical protein
VQLIALTPNPSPDGEGLSEFSRFPLLWERARVREVQGLNAKTYFYAATPKNP